MNIAVENDNKDTRFNKDRTTKVELKISVGNGPNKDGNITMDIETKQANDLKSNSQSLIIFDSDSSLEMDRTKSEEDGLEIRNLDPRSIEAERHVNRLIPREFREKKIGRKRRKLHHNIIGFDPSQFYSCITYINLFIIFASTIISIITLFINSCGNSKLNVKPDFKIFKRTEYCPGADLFFIISIIEILINLVLIIVYTFHCVEYMESFPWLRVEFLIYLTSSFCYLFMSGVMFYYGNWFNIAAIIGIVIALYLFSLAAFKYAKLIRGSVAQMKSDDPDGNKERIKGQCFRFKLPWQRSLRSNKKLKITITEVCKQ